MRPEIILVFLLGLLAGLAINYLADVLPLTRRLGSPMCVHCETEISWIDFVLGKKCPHCSRPRHFRFWVVLVAVIAGALWLWLKPVPRLGFSIGFLVILYLALVATIDIEHRLILHPTSWFGAILGLAVGFWLHGFWATILGGVAGFLVMLALYYLGAWFARWIAKLRGEAIDEVALGFGDVNLSGILGLLLGWPGILAGLVLAILLGGLVSLFFVLGQMIMRKYQPFLAIPYAPFLILGAVLLLYRY
jgi:leader peptidase (prepilin peptidase)/N-methyltransferase